MSVLSLLRSVSPAGLYPPLRSSSGLTGHRTDPNAFGLRAAYAKGLCPTSERGQQAWSAPGTRIVLFIENFHIEPAVRRRLARKDFRVTFEQDFAAVVGSCAAASAGRMDEALIASFVAAFDAGFAHSVEIWDRSGALAGGIFGFAIGRVFFTEGCFARARNASKVGFVALNCHLQRWRYLMNDGKHLSGRLCQLGFLPVQRAAFDALLAMACTGTGQEGRWAVDQTLNLAAWNPRAMSALH